LPTKILHITNGDSLNDRLINLNIKGDFAVWREMLCEGKTTYILGDNEFIKTRKSFLKDHYAINVSDYTEKFISQLEIINNANDYDVVILWFEYDLFCHINMIACISYLLHASCTTPISLVCSGEISGETSLKGLPELSDKQLLRHYKEKIQLTSNDLLLCDIIWSIYCSDTHIHLQPELAARSSFIYLANCIQAHKERFPCKQSSINALETKILTLIKEHTITSERQLCSLTLRNQGYYGYGDMQIVKIIEYLRPYFESTAAQLTLTDKGIKVLDGKYTVHKSVPSCYFGGVSKYAYTYHKDSQQLLIA